MAIDLLHVPTTREGLQALSTAQLKATFAQVTERETKSNNREYLIRRVLQRLEVIALQSRVGGKPSAAASCEAAVPPNEEEHVVYDADQPAEADALADEAMGRTEAELEQEAEPTEAEPTEAEPTEAEPTEAELEQEAAQAGIDAYEAVRHQQREEAKPKVSARPKPKPRAPAEPTEPRGSTPDDLQATLRAEAQETVKAVLADAGVEKITQLGVDALRDLYEQVIGRATGSDNHSYLVWKLREALKGNIPLGAHRGSGRPRGQGKANTKKVIPVGLEKGIVTDLDAVWQQHGFPSRVEFIRHALGLALEQLNETELAVQVRSA